MTTGDLLQGTPLHPEWTRGLFRAARRIVLVFAALTVALELWRPTRATWPDVLIYLAFPAWFLSLLFSMGWPPRASARREHGVAIVRFTPGWRYGFRACLIVPFAGVLLPMLPQAPEDPIGAGGMLVFFAATCAVAILLPREVFRLTSAGVERTSPWTGRATSLRWAEVEKVELDRFRRVVLHGAGKKLEVSVALEGGGDLAAQALALLPASVLDGGVNVRPVLEATAARLTGTGHPNVAAAPPRGRRATMFVLAVVLVACGIGAWSYSQGLETDLRVPIPAGWVDLSPGAPERNFDGFPPEIREQVKQHEPVVFAAERPADPAAYPDQVLLVRIHNGELDVANAGRSLGLELEKAVANARVTSLDVQDVAGVRTVRAEVSSPDGGAIIYALPVIARTATILFTCATPECGRVRDLAAASVSATVGVAEPHDGARYIGPLVRAVAMLAIYAGFYAALIALDARLRRPGATGAAGAIAPALSAPVVEVPLAAGALRHKALIMWGALLAGSVLALGTAVAVQPRLISSQPPTSFVALLAGLSLAAFAVSLAAPRIVRDRADGDVESSALTRHVAVIGSCEASVVIAVLAFLLAREPAWLAFTAAGFLGFVISFPNARRWALLRRGTSTAPGGGISRPAR